MNTSKNPTKPATTAGLSGIAQRIRHAARVVGIVAVTAPGCRVPGRTRVSCEPCRDVGAFIV